MAKIFAQMGVRARTQISYHDCMNWDTVAGETLRQRRIVAGLSQRALAARSGVKQTAIARIETHRSQPTLPVLGRLLDALDIELQPVEIPVLEQGIAVQVAKEVKVILSTAGLSRNDLSEAFRAVVGIVDEFQRSSANDFRRSVTSPPASTGLRGFDALIASLVEDLSEQAQVGPPSWVNDEWRFADGWFTSGIPSLRSAAISASPPAFRRHGVYSLPDEFSRA